MWNQWQWGDVMPSQRQRLHQQPSGFNRSKGQQQNVEEGNDEPKSPPPLSPQPSDDDASAASSSTWKFPRLTPSQPNDQMQLPDDLSSKSTKINILVDPFKAVLAPTVGQNDTSIITDKVESGKLGMHSEDLNPNNSSDGPLATPLDSRDSALDQAGENKATVIDSDENKNKDITSTTTQVEGVDVAKNNEMGSSTALVLPAPKPLEIPRASSPPPPQNDPPASSSSPPLPLLGFYDKDKSTLSSSPSGEESNTNDADSITDEKRDNKEEEPLESPDAWYPSMMDKKDYDFRDRRLDY